MEALTNKPLGTITFQLNQLVKMLCKDDTSLAVKLAEAAARTAQLVDSGLWPLELRLQAELKLLFDEVKATFSNNDSITTIIQRHLASAFRAMKKFVEAEIYDGMDTCQSVNTIAVLASDIFNQNAKRYLEVVVLYRNALTLGYENLTDAICPSAVRAEIGYVYIELAKVLIASGHYDTAEVEIDHLITLNDKSIGESNKNNELVFALMDAYKLLVQMSSRQCAAFNDKSSARLLKTALAVANRVLDQDRGNLSTRMNLLKVVSPSF